MFSYQPWAFDTRLIPCMLSFSVVLPRYTLSFHISAVSDSSVFSIAKCFMFSLSPNLTVAFEHRLFKRSASGSIPAISCNSVILDLMFPLSAVRSAEFWIVCNVCRFVIDVLHVTTHPVSSTGLIYCLYSFNRVLALAPHLRPLTTRRSLTLREATFALFLQ